MNQLEYYFIHADINNEGGLAKVKDLRPVEYLLRAKKLQISLNIICSINFICAILKWLNHYFLQHLLLVCIEVQKWLLENWNQLLSKV